MVDCRKAVKFLVDRMAGVPYGAVKAGGKVRLVKTERLDRLFNSIEQQTNMPGEHLCSISEDAYNIVAKMTKPVRSAQLPEYTENMRYLFDHGSIQIGNISNEELALNMTREVKHPLMELFKYGF